MNKDLIKKMWWIVIPILLAFFISRFLFQITFVVGDSMLPHFENGQQLIIAKPTIIKNINRFDVVIPNHEGQEHYLIKRVIALPGETIQIIDGIIYINGEVLEENYGSEKIENPGIAILPITLNENEYFVLGDNRNNSSDSRNIGLITRDEIIGKVVIRLWPFYVY